MSTYTVIVFALIVVVVVAMFFIGGRSNNSLEQFGLRSGQEILETREQLEADDLEQMLAAHNARRRARGEREVSAEEIEFQLSRDENRMASERDHVRQELGEDSPAGDSRRPGLLDEW